MNDFDNPTKYTELSDEEKVSLQSWINCNLAYRQTINKTLDSYFLKDLYQKSTGHYVTNGQFKGAMLEAGFKVLDKNAQNWVFNVSKRSPALKKC